MAKDCAWRGRECDRNRIRYEGEGHMEVADGYEDGERNPEFEITAQYSAQDPANRYVWPHHLR